MVSVPHDHRGVLPSAQLLNRIEINAVLDQPRGKGMSQVVEAKPCNFGFVQSGAESSEKIPVAYPGAGQTGENEFRSLCPPLRSKQTWRRSIKSRTWGDGYGGIRSRENCMSVNSFFPTAYKGCLPNIVPQNKPPPVTEMF